MGRKRKFEVYIYEHERIEHNNIREERSDGIMDDEVRLVGRSTESETYVVLGAKVDNWTLYRDYDHPRGDERMRYSVVIPVNRGPYWEDDDPSTCTCEDYEKWQHEPGCKCKHIFAAKRVQNVRMHASARQKAAFTQEGRTIPQGQAGASAPAVSEHNDGGTAAARRSFELADPSGHGPIVPVDDRKDTETVLHKSLKGVSFTETQRDELAQLLLEAGLSNVGSRQALEAFEIYQRRHNSVSLESSMESSAQEESTQVSQSAIETAA